MCITGGTAEHWAQIEIEDDNLALKDAVIYYNFTPDQMPEILERPEFLDVYNEPEGLRLVWMLSAGSSDEDAPNRFGIMRSDDGGKTFEEVARIEESECQAGLETLLPMYTYTDKEVREGKTYIYKICAIEENRVSAYSEEKKKTRIVPDYSNFKVTRFSASPTRLNLTGQTSIQLELETLEKMTDGDAFMGKVELVELSSGEKVAEWNEPEYYDGAEGNAHIDISMNASADVQERSLKSNTNYYFRVLDWDGKLLYQSELLKSQYQMWTIEPDIQEISQTKVNLLYGAAKGTLLKLKLENSGGGYWGEDGLCAGMSMGLAAVLRGDLQAENFGGKTSLNQVAEDTPMSEEFGEFTARDYIETCHLLQYLPEIQEADDGLFDYEGLAAAIDAFNSGTGEVPIICLKNAAGIGHMVVPFSYQITDSGDLDITVFNPGVRATEHLTVTDYLSGDAFWNLAGRAGWNNEEISQRNTNTLSYFYLPDIDIEEVVRELSQVGAEESLLYTGSGILVETAGLFGEALDGLLTKITGFSGDGDAAQSSSEGETELYWLHGPGDFDLPVSSLVRLADDYAVYSVEADERAVLTLTEDQNTAGSTVAVGRVAASGDQVNLGCRYFPGGRELDVQFSGKSKDGELVTVKYHPEDDYVEITGAEEGSLQAAYADGTSDERVIRDSFDGGTLYVTADGETKPVISSEKPQKPDEDEDTNYPGGGQNDNDGGENSGGDTQEPDEGEQTPGSDLEDPEDGDTEGGDSDQQPDEEDDQQTGESGEGDQSETEEIDTNHPTGSDNEKTQSGKEENADAQTGREENGDTGSVNPQTGDRTDLAFWLSALGLSVLALGAVSLALIRGRRDGSEER